MASFPCWQREVRTRVSTAMIESVGVHLATDEISLILSTDQPAPSGKR